MLKKLIASLFVFAAMFLAGCGEQTVSTSQARAQADEAWRQGTAAEAAKADAKLSAAKQELGKIGTDVARQGGFSSSANCNVVPDAVNKSAAMKNFPASATAMYREACVKEVAVMNGERKAMKDQAVARAKAREAKLAAKREKAAEIAAKTAKQKHASSMQPVRPSAVKPVAKTDRRH